MKKKTKELWEERKKIKNDQTKIDDNVKLGSFFRVSAGYIMLIFTAYIYRIPDGP